VLHYAGGAPAAELPTAGLGWGEEERVSSRRHYNAWAPPQDAAGLLIGTQLGGRLHAVKHTAPPPVRNMSLRASPPGLTNFHAAAVGAAAASASSARLASAAERVWRGAAA